MPIIWSYVHCKLKLKLQTVLMYNFLTSWMFCHLNKAHSLNEKSSVLLFSILICCWCFQIDLFPPLSRYFIVWSTIIHLYDVSNYWKSTLYEQFVLKLMCRSTTTSEHNWPHELWIATCCWRICTTSSLSWWRYHYSLNSQYFFMKLLQLLICCSLNSPQKVTSGGNEQSKHLFFYRFEND